MKMPGEQLRALFLVAPTKAYGEANVAIPLARSIVSAGGEAWFLASPLAARLANQQFPECAFEMGGNREENQETFWRVIKKYRVNMVVFTELYEIIQPRRQTECPLLSLDFLQDLEYLDASLVFLDFITHVPALQEIASCSMCAEQFGEYALQSFLQRLWVMLPCPLNEPGEVPGRRGVPYRVQDLPVSLRAEDRDRARSGVMGSRRKKEEILIVRTGSTWQAKLAEEYGVRVYDHLIELLEGYLRGVKRPVTLVSVSDKQRLSPNRRSGKLRVVNVSNLAPQEYQRLILSADLVLTDNQIGYTLATTIGSVPGAVMVNSYSAEQIMERERYGTPLWRWVRKVEERHPGSIYPHEIFPLPSEMPSIDGDEETNGNHNGHGSRFSHEVIRLGRMQSSPYVKIEMYGGKSTGDMFRWLLEDPAAKAHLKEVDHAYIERLNRIDDGVTVLDRIFHSDRLVGNTAW
jgi:Family of unknown function (DUF6365)